MRENKREEGSRHERRAADLLAGMGFTILEYNFRSRRGEIDLIAREGGYLVFIEVKYRKTADSGYPAEAVDREKQQRIAAAARYYLMVRGLPEDTPCRFDVVSICGEETEVIRDAFWA